MRSLKTSSIALLSLAFATAACTAGTEADIDDGDDNGGGGGDVDPQPVPLTPEGKFAITSTFDLATNAPGAVGRVANVIIDMTDSPDDPTRYIVERLAAQLPNGSVKDAVNGAIPFVAGYLNDRLLEVAPSFVGKAVEVGNKLGQVTKNFGLLETFEVDAAGVAKRTVTGLHFTIDNVDLDFAFADYGIRETVVDGIRVSLAKTGRLTFDQHTVPLRYGQIMKLAIDQAIIPMIDPSASNLGDLLKSAVNCQAVGKYVFEAIGFGSAGTFQSACTAGLAAGANLLYAQLNNIDGSALEFGVTGEARGIDKNKDGKMDIIATGTWAGTLGYAGTPATLGDAKFFGASM
ncbi:MAG: hypothetical protein KF773_04205 [Deltaproteobacteria bacterium]|nr:hypothetical protein [Deltaproteobacteria bacterium]MCW5801407.1 hypothetical protein [Deltaproteobacteria bacterium]